MVVMDMGEEHRRERAEVEGHKLLAYVGATVYQYARIAMLEQRRTAQPMVVRVMAAAHSTAATQRGHTTRGACAQESERKRLVHGRIRGYFTLTSGWMSMPKRSLTSRWMVW